MKNEIITSKNNDIVKYISFLAEKSGREQYGCFWIEGLRAVSEAIKEKAVKRLIVSQTFAATKDFEYISKSYGNSDAVILSDALFQHISQTRTPQGIGAVCNIKRYDLQKILRQESRILLLEDVRDPGNMGTVIRTAAAAGFKGIIASDGCVDIYNPKVVRSTVGCLFNTQIVQCKGNFINVVQEVRNTGFKVYAAHPRGGQDLFDVVFSPKTAIVLGNEANGISQALLKQCDKFVTIQMESGVESLNASVAAALMMYEVRRPK